MKIAQLIYTNGIAGAEKYLMHLLPPLKQYEIDCHLILICSAGAQKQLSTYCERMNQAGIPATLFVTSRIGFLQTAGKINRYLKTHNIHYLHSHLLNTDVLATLVKFCFNRKILLISTKHGYQESILKKVKDVADVSLIKKMASKQLYYYVTRFIVKRANYNYAVSKAIARLYYNLGLSKQEMPFIHHGITITQPLQTAEACTYRLAPRQLVIVGRLEEYKGHRYLLEAMPLVINKFTDCKLLVIGIGAEQKILQDLVKTLKIDEHVLFMGFQTDPYSYVKNSDVVILPSLFEPFGLVYIEAFALQTPVIAFDTAAGNEIMENNTTALLVPAADSKSLADKIIYLLENPAAARAITERAFIKYKEKFSTETMVKATASFYHKIEQEINGLN